MTLLGQTMNEIVWYDVTHTDIPFIFDIIGVVLITAIPWVLYKAFMTSYNEAKNRPKL